MLDEAKKNPKKYKFTQRDKERIEALHDGEISYHDEHFGKFLDKLAELGLDENTILVVTSDHGEEFQEHGSWGTVTRSTKSYSVCRCCSGGPASFPQTFGSIRS